MTREQLDRPDCPWCGDWNTRTVNIEWTTESVEETRVCDHCGSQYTLGFRDMVLLGVLDEDGNEREV